MQLGIIIQKLYGLRAFDKNIISNTEAIRHHVSPVAQESPSVTRYVHLVNDCPRGAIGHRSRCKVYLIGLVLRVTVKRLMTRWLKCVHISCIVKNETRALRF